MSAHTVQAKRPLTPVDIEQMKGKDKIAMVTAYDYPSACMAEQAGIDVILVGDSLGMVVLGMQDTVGVTLEMMVHHTRPVVAGAGRTLVVADLPFMTYEKGVGQALDSAAYLAQNSGVRAVKLEGGTFIIPQVQALVQSGIAVMGHLGLTPQRAATLGGFKVQGRTAEAAGKLLQEARALEKAGCFAIVLEAVPELVAARVTAALTIPTIGIGGGGHCDGQVLVLHDMLGLHQGHVPRFVRQYARLAEAGRQAISEYVAEVKSGAFPAKEHGFSMPEEEAEQLRQL